MTTPDLEPHFPVCLLHRPGSRGKTEERRKCAHCRQSYALITPNTVLRAHLDEHIVADMGVTPKYTVRWSEARMNQLWNEGQLWQPAMRDTVEVLKKRIMSWVRAQDAEENAQDPLSVEL